MRVVLLVLLLVPLGAFGGAATVVLTPADAAPTDRHVDAVVALAGDGERLRVAEDIAESSGATLVLSWIPGADSDRDAVCEDDRADALCFHPNPVSTAGEARAIGGLFEREAWEVVVVVTSRYHVGRAEMLVAQCVDDAQVHVVSATEALAAAHVLEESLGVLVGWTLQRAC